MSSRSYHQRTIDIEQSDHLAIPNTLSDISDNLSKINSIVLDCWFQYEYLVNIERWKEEYKLRSATSREKIEQFFSSNDDSTAANMIEFLTSAAEKSDQAINRLNDNIDSVKSNISDVVHGLYQTKVCLDNCLKDFKGTYDAIKSCEIHALTEYMREAKTQNEAIESVVKQSENIPSKAVSYLDRVNSNRKRNGEMKNFIVNDDESENNKNEETNSDEDYSNKDSRSKINKRMSKGGKASSSSSTRPKKPRKSNSKDARPSDQPSIEGSFQNARDKPEWLSNTHPNEIKYQNYYNSEDAQLYTDGSNPVESDNEENQPSSSLRKLDQRLSLSHESDLGIESFRAEANDSCSNDGFANFESPKLSKHFQGLTYQRLSKGSAKSKKPLNEKTENGISTGDDNIVVLD